MEQLIASGRYPNATAIIADGIRLLAAKEHYREPSPLPSRLQVVAGNEMIKGRGFNLGDFLRDFCIKHLDT